ncbi:MAG TPA: sodium:solute symporter family protein [Acidobacteriota bacterium]|nr:sodium:solute symporter family protein [Acidobacteriota bacterium]HQG91672.1 sodium:solute symporter family protein [Acidobacteriota bacterium]
MVRALIIIVYLAAVAVAGLWHVRASRRPDDYFVAGRRGAFWQVFGSLGATIVGASATLGVCGMAATSGFGASAWLWGGALGLIAAGWAARRLRQAETVYTVPEYLGIQFGPLVRRLSGLLIVTGWIGVIAAQLLAIGWIVGPVADCPAPLAMTVSAFLLGAYVTAGGQKSVLRTDLLQLGALTIGITMLGVAAWRSLAAGESAALLQMRWTDFIADLPSRGGDYLSLALVTCILFATGPDIFSRFLCARTAMTFRRAAVACGTLLIPFSLWISAIGVIGATVLPVTRGDALLPTLTVAVLPEWGQGLVLAGLLAAVISSADTCLLTASSILVMEVSPESAHPDRDAFRRRMRVAVPLVLLVALVAALIYPSIIGALLTGYQIYAAAVSPLLLLAVAGQGTRIGNRMAAGLSLAGALVGFGAVLTGFSWLLAVWFGCVGGGVLGAWVMDWQKKRAVPKERLHADDSSYLT